MFRFLFDNFIESRIGRMERDFEGFRLASYDFACKQVNHLGRFLRAPDYSFSTLFAVDGKKALIGKDRRVRPRFRSPKYFQAGSILRSKNPWEQRDEKQLNNLFNFHHLENKSII